MPVRGVGQREGPRLVTYSLLVFEFVHMFIQRPAIAVEMYTEAMEHGNIHLR